MDISKDPKSNRNLYVCITAVFLCLILFYLPSVGGKFGYLNDYTIFEYNPHQCCLGFPETIQLFAIGRPIQALLLNWQLMFVNGIDSLQPMRIFFVMMICFAATGFFVHIQRHFNISRYSAAVLSLLIFTLPSMTINSFWVAQSIPGIVPIFFVLLAHSIMQIRGAMYIRCICFATAFFLIYISLFIYPPATFFFLTLTLIKFMFGAKDVHQTRLCNIHIEIVLLLTSCLVYFLTVKYILKPILITSHFGGMNFSSIFHDIDVKNTAYRFSVSFDPVDKIARFYDLFRLIFSIWFPPLGLGFIIPIMAVFWSTLAYASLDSPYLKNLNRTYRIIFGLSLATFILLLSPLPVIIGQGNYPMLYRVTFAPMAIIAVAIVFIMDRVFQMTNIGRKKYAFLCIIGIFILAGETSSYKRLVLMERRLSAEYSHVFNVVKKADDAGFKEIKILPIESPPDPRGFLFRDFGYTAVNSITLGMVNAALQELGRDETQYHVRYDPLGQR
ncbi:MAG: hypothetical protein A3F18_02905 [Legionellales bacterium RIFCSPHIGHO2_12_FULL_37_14]|nr:MAG: hypothetical protein A3F18_02905 [Legionellales bacterium RIFCSPHIGHO2_12_FULL_37_14]